MRTGATTLAAALIVVSGAVGVQAIAAPTPSGTRMGAGRAGKAGDARNPPMATSSAKHKLKQGRHYLKKGLIKQAIARLKAGLALPQSSHTGKLAVALHKAYRKAGRFDDAMDAVERHRTLKGPDALWKKLTTDFGPLRFVGARARDLKVVGAVAVHAPGLISTDKKEVFRQAQLRLGGGVQLPFLIWLPFGEYRIGGAAYTHRAAPGAAPDLRVAMPRIAVIAEHRRDLDGPVVEAMGMEVGGELRRVLAADLNKKKAAKALLAWSPELVITLGAGATQMSRMLLPKTPTVFASVPKDMWKRMLRRGRQGVTGVATEAPWPVVSRLFRQIAPGVKRVGIVVRRRTQAQADYAAAALKRAGVEVIIEAVRHPEQARTALARVVRGADALWALPDTELWNDPNRKLFAQICDERAIPCLAPDEALVEDGVLMAVRPPDDVLGARLAQLARAIVRDGKEAHDLPISPPSGYAYVLNAHTAEVLGLNLSEDALEAAARLHGRAVSASATTQ